MWFIVTGLALLLDQLLGEPKRFHPLIGFGHVANHVEKRLNRNSESLTAFAWGAVSLLFLVLPLSISSYYLFELLGEWHEVFGSVIAVLVLYLAIGFNSLIQHSDRVANAFQTNDLEQARYATSLMVSRDTQNMNEPEITRAVIESTLENGCDSTFGVLFWFVVGGVPMVIFYRLVNTLDAMWGYRTRRFELFGKCAAKLDDFLNYIPARLTALSYAICGNWQIAIRCWRLYANKLASPNGGPVMTAGAGSLNIKLGGPAYYHGNEIDKPFFGGTESVVNSDIIRANRLLTRALLVWWIALILLSVLTKLVMKSAVLGTIV